MSKSAVARLSRVSLPTVNRILAGKEQAPTLANLHAIARALGVVIRLGSGDEIEVDEPQSADEYRLARALNKAKQLMGMVQGTMALEAQAVDPGSIERMVDHATHELLNSKRRLWSE